MIREQIMILFQNIIKCSNFILKSLFAYRQNPYKNLSIMTKYVFLKYRDVQKRKCVFSLLDHNSQIVKNSKFFSPGFFSEDLSKSLDTIYSLGCSPINLLTTSGPVCIVNKGKFCPFISQTLFFHNVQRHLFLQSINSINRKISEFLIKKVIICKLE